METLTLPQHVTGTDPVATTEVTIASGQNLAALTPIAQNAAGEFVAVAPAASDGTQIAVYLTAIAVDASASAKKTQVYKCGTFDFDQVVWSTQTAAQKAKSFVGTPISLQPYQS